MSCTVLIVDPNDAGLQLTPSSSHPQGTLGVTLTQDDGSQQSFQGVSTSFSFTELKKLCDEVYNDSQDPAFSGQAALLTQPEKSRALTKGNIAGIQTALEQAAGLRPGGDRLGGKLAFCSAEMTDETGKVIVRAHCVMCFTGRALPL